MSLYNKYRPIKFEDITQSQVTRVLKAQIATNNHVSTYLFAGPSGTGKTTIARTMAMALLCENIQENEPCGQCESCKLIISDRHRDVVEINCATNGGVDETRTMISDRVRVSPAIGNYRIFLLDESHSLSNSSQNALLKILEEPPSYVKFFLCTTEMYKVVTAVRNRCQIHLMSNVSENDIYNVLKKISDSEKLKYDDSALRLLSESFNGSVRASIVALEQVSLVGVTEENVRNVLGRGPRNLSLNLLLAIIKNDKAEAFKILDIVKAGGYDFLLLMEESSKILMDIVRLKILSKKPNDNDTLMVELFNLYNGTSLMAVVNNFIEGMIRIKQNIDSDLVVQVEVLKAIAQISKINK